MSLRLDGEVAHLEGVVGVEEAEGLLEWLQEAPGRAVDWSACDHLHTAVLQVLMALGPPLQGRPRDPFLARWVAPWLEEGGDAPTSAAGL